MRVIAATPVRWVPCVGLVISACLIHSSSQSRLWTREHPVPADSHNDISVGTILHPAYPGLDPQYGSMGLSSYLYRRDCLANGSNYCFGNTVDFCPNCGTCCTGSSGQFCCSDATSTCCGRGCCQAGDVCTNGQCATPVVTTTTTTTIVTTVTHLATELAKVELQVDETSTVLSTVVVTASDIDTATDVTYTTTTVAAAAKRSLPSLSPVKSLDQRQDSVPSSSLVRLSLLLARLTRRALNDDDSGPISPFAPRFDPVPWTYQEESRGIKEPRAASTVTSIVTVTITTDVTSTVSSTLTTLMTSTDLITSIQTKTSVLNAKATVSTTSTVVVTRKPPVTQTTTEVTTILASDASLPSTSSQTSDHIPGSTTTADPSTSLPTPAIIGISVGCAVAAILLIGAFVIWRIRRRRQSAPSYEPWTPPGPSPLQISMAAAPRVQRPPEPMDFSTFTRPPRTSKRSSGQSNLLKPGATQGQEGRNRSSTGTQSQTGSSTLRGSTPVEVAGSNPSERHEMEGGQPTPNGHSRTVSETSIGQRFMYRS